jgi:hypothetical protein
MILVPGTHNPQNGASPGGRVAAMTKEEAAKFLRECSEGKRGEEARKQAERMKRECLEHLSDAQLFAELRRRGLVN